MTFGGVCKPSVNQGEGAGQTGEINPPQHPVRNVAVHSRRFRATCSFKLANWVDICVLILNYYCRKYIDNYSNTACVSGPIFIVYISISRWFVGSLKIMGQCIGTLVHGILLEKTGAFFYCI
jgi:hypothetical protein